MQDIKNEEVLFSLVGKPKVILTSTSLNYFLEEVKKLLDEFVRIMVDEFPSELPPIRSISHHIDLILGTDLSNKEAYRMTPKENEEIKNQVQEFLDKGLIEESLSPCVVQRKMEDGECVKILEL
jgi:hypothetical protein